MCSYTGLLEFEKALKKHPQNKVSLENTISVESTQLVWEQNNQLQLLDQLPRTSGGLRILLLGRQLAETTS